MLNDKLISILRKKEWELSKEMEAVKNLLSIYEPPEVPENIFQTRKEVNYPKESTTRAIDEEILSSLSLENWITTKNYKDFPDLRKYSELQIRNRLKVLRLNGKLSCPNPNNYPIMYFLPEKQNH